MLILVITVRVSYTIPSSIMVALVARILLGYVLLCSLKIGDTDTGGVSVSVNTSFINLLCVMEADRRCRIWIATIRWVDAVPPTSRDIPHLHEDYSSSIYSAHNQSLSTLYKFQNAIRASTISVAYDDTELLVLKTAKLPDIANFNELPGEWRHTNGTLDDQPATDSVRTPADGGVQDIINVDDIIAPFDYNACVARCKRIRDEITTLDDELGRLSKRFRTAAVDMLDL